MPKAAHTVLVGRHPLKPLPSVYYPPTHTNKTERQTDRQTDRHAVYNLHTGV